MEIEQIDLTNVEEVAGLFDRYRIFYNQTSDNRRNQFFNRAYSQ